MAATPLALAAGVYFFEEVGRPEKVAAHGLMNRSSRAWHLVPGEAGAPSGPLPATTGEDGLATATSSGGGVGPGPESQVIGEGRTPGTDDASPPPGAPGSNDAGTSSGGGGGRTPGAPRKGASAAGYSFALDGQTTTSTSPEDKKAKAPDVEDLPPGTGLRGEYWDHDSELRRIPNLDLSGATLVRLDPVIDFDPDRWNLPFVPLETWATCWRGYLKVLNPGRHAFVLGSDDGGLLEIDNRVVCGQDRLQGYTESTGEAELPKGLHVVKVRFFNNRGPGACKLFWVPPGALEKALIPPDVLYPAGGPAEVGRPQIASIGPPGAKRDEPIKIAGSGFSDIPTLNKVRFGPAKVSAIVIAATPAELTVLVPPGVDDGPVEVTVGDQATPAVPYAVGGLFGLSARIWRAPGEADVLDYADPQTSQQADDERLVGPVNAHGARGFRLPFPAVRFRACYEGRFYAHQPGDHGFALECDDGGRLVVDGRLVADGPGLHPRQRFEGKLFLSPGWHDVRIDYFQNQGGADLTLLHAEPEGALAVCPRALLAPPVDFERRIVPAVLEMNPQPARAGDRVLITGEGLVGFDGRPPRVTLGGVALPIVAASPGTVVVEVPPGVDSGDLIVRSGPLESAPRPLTVTGYGLKGEYWQLTAPLDRLPAFDSAPTLVRLDDRVDFTEDAAFHVPFSAEHFAARWTGDLWVGEDGVYELGTGTDDGSRLLIDGAPVVENDGLHGYQEVWASVHLAPGRHSLVLTFFENEGESRCRLLWKTPKGRRTAIPRTSLLPPP